NHERLALLVAVLAVVALTILAIPWSQQVAGPFAPGPQGVGVKRQLGMPQFTAIPDHRWILPRADRFLLGLFALLVAAPLIAFSLGVESGNAMGENRYLA